MLLLLPLFLYFATGYSTMACVGGVGLDGGAEVGILCAGGLGSTGQVSDAVQFLPLWPAPAPCRLLGKLPIQTRASQMLLTGGRLFMSECSSYSH